MRLKFGEQARGSIVRGIERMADTVAITLGPGVRMIWFNECRVVMLRWNMKEGILRSLRMGLQ